MANKRPPIDMGELTENLKHSSAQGMGAFFPPAPSPASPEESSTDTPSVPHLVETENEATSALENVVTSRRDDVNLRTWRDIIEDTETHNSALRVTNEERYAIEDVVNDLKRKYKVKTSMNELARLGLLSLIHDFKKHKQHSLIVVVKKS